MTTTFTDAMTPDALLVECKALREKLGPKAYVSTEVGVSDYSHHEDKPALVTMYPEGVGGAVDGHRIRAKTWDAALKQAHKWASDYLPVKRNAMIRRMALAIIELTDEHGSCTERLLQTKNFTTSDIRAYQAEACNRAGEMAGNAPFTVIMGV